VVESPAEFAGRKLFSNLNLEHANPEVVKIATRQLHSLTLMAGIKSLTDPSELVACTITAKVKVKKREDTGEMQNEVVYAFKANGNPAVGPAKASTPAGPAPKPAGDW
jgi:4-aminobutyrate aminotransferase-like enzyme